MQRYCTPRTARHVSPAVTRRLELTGVRTPSAVLSPVMVLHICLAPLFTPVPGHPCERLTFVVVKRGSEIARRANELITDSAFENKRCRHHLWTSSVRHDDALPANVRCRMSQLDVQLIECSPLRFRNHMSTYGYTHGVL